MSNVERVWRWCRRKPAVAASLITATTALVAVAVLALISIQLRLSQQTAENRQLRLDSLERAAELRKSQLDAANKLAATQQQVAATQHFYRLLSGIRERVTDPRPGWAFDGLDDLRQAIELNVEGVDPVELRSVATQCLTGFDLRQRHEFRMPIGYRSYRVAVHPQGSLFAVASLKNRLRLYVCICDAATGERTHEFYVMSRALLDFDGVRRIAFIDNGDTLAISTRSGYVHRWDLRQVSPQAVTVKMPLPALEEHFVDFHPAAGGAYLSDGQHVYQWPDFNSDTTRRIVEDASRVLDVSPDGRLLAVYKGETTVVDLETEEKLWSFVGDRFAEFSRDGRRLATVESDRLVVLDAWSGERLWEAFDPQIGRLHEGTLLTLHFSPDGALLLTGGADQKLKVWDSASGTLLTSIFLGGSDEIDPQITSDGSYLTTTGDKCGVVFEINGAALRSALAHQNRIDDFAFASESGHSATVVSLGRRGVHTRLWDAAGQLRGWWTLPGVAGREACVSLLPDATRIAATERDCRRVWTWPAPDLAGPGDELPEVRGAEEPAGLEDRKASHPGHVAVDRSGAAVWHVENDDELVCRSMPGMEEVHRWSNELAGRIFGVGGISVVVPGRQQLLAGTKSGSLVVFDTESYKPRQLLTTRGRISAAAFSQDESLVAYGTADGLLAVVNSVSGEPMEMQLSEQHHDLVTSVAFGENGRLLFSASRDRTIRCWQRRGDVWLLVLSLPLPRAPLRVEVAAEGRLLALLQGESSLRRWDMPELRRRLGELGLDWPSD